MDFNVKMTEEEIIEEINKLKEELNNLENNNDEIAKFQLWSKNLMKLSMVMAIFTIVIFWCPGISIPVISMFFGSSTITVVLSGLINGFSKDLKSSNIKKEADYIKMIAGYGTILQHRKGKKIDNMWIKNLNVNFKNIPEVACDVKEINEEYIKGAFSNVEITEITDLLMNYLDNKDKVTNENENSDAKKLIRK